MSGRDGGTGGRDRGWGSRLRLSGQRAAEADSCSVSMDAPCGPGPGEGGRGWRRGTALEAGGAGTAQQLRAEHHPQEPETLRKHCALRRGQQTAGLPHCTDPRPPLPRVHHSSPAVMGVRTPRASRQPSASHLRPAGHTRSPPVTQPGPFNPAPLPPRAEVTAWAPCPAPP